MRPIEVIAEVTVAVGPGAAHRAWPSLERTAKGDLVVAYKVSPDHYRADDGVLWGGSLALTRLRDGSLLLDRICDRHPGTDEPSPGFCYEKVYELPGGRLIETIYLAAWRWRDLSLHIASPSSLRVRARPICCHGRRPAASHASRGAPTADGGLYRSTAAGQIQ